MLPSPEGRSRFIRYVDVDAVSEARNDHQSLFGRRERRSYG